MRINQNIMAYNAYRNLSSASTQMGKSLEKLSSGFRINRAADDAAGLVISNRLRAQTSGLRVASRNAQDGISVVQTAESALNEVQNMLNRMRDLAVQSANTGSLDTEARDAAHAELSELRNEIGRIAVNTSFGTQELLDGTYGVKPTVVAGTADVASVDFAGTEDFDIAVTGGSGTVTVTMANTGSLSGEEAAEYLTTSVRSALLATGDSVDAAAAAKVEFSYENSRFSFSNGSSAIVTLTDNTTLSVLSVADGAVAAATGSGGVFQVGNDVTGVQQIEVSITDIRISGGTNAIFTALNTIDISGTGNAATAQQAIDAAIDEVSTIRGDLGAKQNRFESTIANLDTIVENLAASESRIRDADMALEMTGFTRNQILVQAGTAMLAQANAVPQNVLSLLRG